MKMPYRKVQTFILSAPVPLFLKSGILVFVITMFVSGCSDKSPGDEIPGDPLVIEIGKLSPGDSSLLQNVTYIPLETNDQCLIGNIEKILYKHDQFYIIDKNITKSILVFDSAGKFLWKIDKRGKGIGEYTELMDFDLDSLGNVYLYDNGSMKILKYDSKGKFIREYKSNNRFLDFSILSDNNILVYHVFGEDDDHINLGIYDIKKRKVKPVLKSRAVFDDDDLPFFRYNSLYKSNDIIYFSPRFSNRIYKIGAKDGSISNAIQLNGIPTPSKDYLTKAKKNKVVLDSDYKFLYDINCIYETSDFIYFSYIIPYRITLVYNKKSKKYFPINFQLDTDYFGSNLALGVTDEEIISIIPSYILQQKWSDKVNQSTLSPVIKEKLMAVTANSNPVLVLTKFKDF